MVIYAILHCQRVAITKWNNRSAARSGDIPLTPALWYPGSDDMIVTRLPPQERFSELCGIRMWGVYTCHLFDVEAALQMYWS